MKLSLDGWADGRVAPAEVELPVVAPKREVKLEPVSPRLKARLEHPTRRGMMAHIRYSADGSRLVASSYPQGVVQFWDAATGRQTAKIETPHTGYTGDEFAQLSPDWSTLYVPVEGRASERFERDGKTMTRWIMSGSIGVWDVATRRPRPPLRNDPPSNPITCVVSNDGRWLAVNELHSGESESGPTYGGSLWDIAAGTRRPLPERAISYFFAPDGRTLVASRHDAKAEPAILLIDPVTLAVRHTIPAGVRHGNASPAALSPDGRRLVGNVVAIPDEKDGSNFSARVAVWDVTTGREVASYAAGEPKTHLSATPSPDGRTVAVAKRRIFRDATALRAKLYLLDAATLATRQTVDFATDSLLSAPVFRPDGRLIAVRAGIPNDGNPREWSAEDYPQPKVLLVDVATGATRATLVLPQCVCLSLAFSPDGKTLAAGGLGQVLLFDVGDL